MVNGRGINVDGLTGEAVNLIREKSPIEKLMARYGLRQWELNNERIWRDIGITEPEQDQLREYAATIGLAIYDRPYQQTRFSADSIAAPVVEQKPEQKAHEETIDELEEKLKKAKLRQQIADIERANKVLSSKKTLRKWKSLRPKQSKA